MITRESLIIETCSDTDTDWRLKSVATSTNSTRVRITRLICGKQPRAGDAGTLELGMIWNN